MKRQTVLVLALIVVEFWECVSVVILGAIGMAFSSWLPKRKRMVYNNIFTPLRESRFFLSFRTAGAFIYLR
jgi:uncharacterized membrane protein